jgi:hypothetical protein
MIRSDYGHNVFHVIPHEHDECIAKTRGLVAWLASLQY